MVRHPGCIEATRSAAWRNVSSHARLIGQIFQAFDDACDLDDIEIARGLLAVIDNFLSAETEKLDGAEQPFAERLIQAHFRLLELRYHY